MASHQVIELKGLEALPADVLHLILDKLDVESLKSAVLSGAAVYFAFKGRENWLVHRLLRSEIGNELMFDALAAHFSIGARYGPRAAVFEYIAMVYARDKESIDGCLSMAEGLAMLKLHETVQFFSEKLGSELLKNGNPSPAEWPMSAAERLRICRALYRFELYCNVTPDVMYWDRGYPHYAPWENEQLACVYQALLKVVYPATNQMFGGLSYYGQSDRMRFEVYENCRTQISHGLLHVKLHDVATSPEVRAMLPHLQPDLHRGFYFHEFMRHAIRPWKAPLGRQRYDGENPIPFTPSYSDDGDTGPEAIWRWAHPGLMLTKSTNNRLRVKIRDWGYVFWDRIRLDARGTMSQPWRDPYY